MLLTVVDYGVGNLRSIAKSIEKANFDSKLNYSIKVSSDINDVKGIASHHIPTGMDQSVAQMKNCLNVSDDDAAGFAMDKVVVITAKTDDALTTGEGVLNMYWTQQINNTN